MFGGSLHIPEYDTPLQMAGGENNAYTTNDLTNYYLQLPAQNLETALWLESDRMLSLAFSPESLEVQRRVVCEEYKEHYLNKPYGDAWHLLRDLSYTTHPYRWMTIGKELAHIEQATLEDVKSFFSKHYTPANAILVVAGPVKPDEVLQQVSKWFGDIPAGHKYKRVLPSEPSQSRALVSEVEKAVPLDALYKTWHMAGRLEASYYATDLLTEVIGGGTSSRLHQSLVKEKKLFSNLDCYHFGTVDPGLVTIEGKLVKGVKMEDAEKAVDYEISLLLEKGIEERELSKAKNKTESLLAFEDMSLMNRAGNLAFYELLGDASKMNEEWQRFQEVSLTDVQATAESIFQPANSHTLRYYATH
jgi:predicted Zn-dependent peptidase